MSPAAIRAGKQVLTEKPFACNAAEARQVHGVAQHSDRVVFEGFHYHPIVASFLQLIAGGTRHRCDQTWLRQIIGPPTAAIRPSR